MTRESGHSIAMPLDKEIAQRYVAYLLERKIEDSAEARRAFCEASGCHAKLIYNNPHIGAIEGLFRKQLNIEQLSNISLRDYLLYHYHYIHQGYRYGAPELQQRWLGHDIIKTPWDCWIYQEIIWETRPDFVIELGVMFGGSAHFYAGILDLIGAGEVIGIDVSLAKAKAPQNKRIRYMEGSSSAKETVETVR